jgi:putative heme iron utilization protein
MHKELKLPIKCANGQLAMGYVCIKFVVDLKEGLTFVSVVKLAHDRSSHVLMDFTGQVTECE